MSTDGARKKSPFIIISNKIFVIHLTMIILYHIMKHINRKEIKYEKEKFTVDLHATGRYVGTRPLRMQFVRFY